MAFGIFDGKFAAAVVRVLERANNLSTRCYGAGVDCFDVRYDDVDAAGFNAAQLIRRLEFVAVFVVFRGPEHDHAAVEGELSVADGSVFFLVDGVAGEADNAAEPFDGCVCVAVAQSGDDSRWCLDCRVRHEDLRFVQ